MSQLSQVSTHDVPAKPAINPVYRKRMLMHRIGIALSVASGSMEFLQDGAWTKRMHPGWAAVAGLWPLWIGCALLVLACLALRRQS